MVSSILLVSLVNGETSVGTTSTHSAEDAYRSWDFVWMWTFHYQDSGSGPMKIDEERVRKLSPALARYNHSTYSLSQYTLTLFGC